MTKLLAFALLCSLSQALKLYQSGSVFPVFHNVQHHHVKQLSEIVSNCYLCALSIGRPKDLSTLSKFCRENKKCVVGVSTNDQQNRMFQKFSDCGAQLISSPTVSSDYVNRVKKFGLSVVCGVSSFADCEKAVESGCDALNFVSGYKLDPKSLAKVVKDLRNDRNFDCPIYVSGVTSYTEFERYLEQDETINFMVDFDFAKSSGENIHKELSEIRKRVYDLGLKLRIQRDLKNSCL